MDETRPIPDERDQYRAVARRDLRENGIAWLPYAPFNNTYGLAVRREAAGRLGVRTISDLARLARERPADASICVAEEFLSRDDGLPGLEAAYGFRFPPDRILKLDEGLVYDQVDSGERCNFGEVFLTDGRIGANDLVTLEDDRRFFPKYNPAPTSGPRCSPPPRPYAGSSSASAGAWTPRRCALSTAAWTSRASPRRRWPSPGWPSRDSCRREPGSRRRASASSAVLPT